MTLHQSKKEMSLTLALDEIRHQNHHHRSSFFFQFIAIISQLFLLFINCNKNALFFFFLFLLLLLPDSIASLQFPVTFQLLSNTFYLHLRFQSLEPFVSLTQKLFLPPFPLNFILSSSTLFLLLNYNLLLQARISRLL